MRRIAFLFVFVACAALTASSNEEKGRIKTVSTLLNAKWASTPTELEISEFLNDEDPSFFWSFLEKLHDKSGDLADSSYLLGDSFSNRLTCNISFFL